MDNRKLESLVGYYVELEETIWKVVAIDNKSALLSRELGSNRKCRNVDTSRCLDVLVIDEDIELDSSEHNRSGRISQLESTVAE